MENLSPSPEPDPIAEARRDLALDRLRGKTDPVVVATHRLHDEIERIANAVSVRQDNAERLRPQDAAAEPVAARLGEVDRLRDALQALAASATRLETEVERVRAASERHAELLRGTELAYQARDAAAVIGAFARHLILAGSNPDAYAPFGADQMRRLTDVLGSALTDLGADFDPNAQGRRRLRGRT